MKMNYLIPIISAIFLGFLCALFVLGKYNKSEAMVLGSKVYFLQVAAYNNIESSKDDFKNIDNKITIKENDKYYTYIGITSMESEANRIKELYKSENINIYIKEKYINNENFVNELVQYDVLLKNSNTLEEINSIFKTILATFEENLENF